MKRLFFVFSFIGILFWANAQKIKTITNETSLTIEEFEVLKPKRKIRHGKYIKKLKYKETTVAKGQFENNIKTGIWQYFDYITGELEQEYDYDKNILLYSNLERTNPNHFYYNGEWILENIDTMPILIGGMSGLQLKLIETAYAETKPGDFPNAGTAIFSFIVTTDGKTKDYKILKSSENMFEEDLLNVIKEYDAEWIPGRYKGVNVETEFLIPMHIVYSEDTSEKKIYKISFRTWG